MRKYMNIGLFIIFIDVLLLLVNILSGVNSYFKNVDIFGYYFDRFD